MARFSLLSRLLVILAIIALAFAPVPVAARGGMSVGVMEGMDCCPPGDPVMPDCQKSCPYLMLCMAKCFPAANTAFTRLALLDAVSNSHRISSDEGIDAWSIRPPAPPPRIQDIAGV